MIKKLIAIVVVIMICLTNSPLFVLPACAETTTQVIDGDYIKFGSYLGDPILWRVININNDGTYMLYSEEILCLKPYDAAESGVNYTAGGSITTDENRQKYGSNNWEDSNLREWLNSQDEVVNYNTQPPTKVAVTKNAYAVEAGFLSNFKQSEKDMIIPVTHNSLLAKVDMSTRDGGSESHIANYDIANVIQNYDTAYYKNVTDKVFLLDVKELHNYVYAKGYEYSKKPTQKAVQYSEYKYPDFLGSDKYWRNWLRSPGTDYSFTVRRVSYGGSIEYNYYYPIDGDTGVAPALNLKSEILISEGDGSKSNPFILAMGSHETFSPPKADSVSIVGEVKLGSTITGNYQYSDVEGDVEYGTAYRWLLSDSKDGEFKPIEGATNISYTLKENDCFKYIKFEVTPKNQLNPPQGLAEASLANFVKNDSFVENNNILEISAGRFFTAAIKKDGRVDVWGYNPNGQCNSPKWLITAKNISAGDNHVVVLKADGTVVAWGAQSNVPQGLTNVKAVAAGYGHTVALKTDGTVEAWGNNGQGQCNVPQGLNNVKAIAAGLNHTVALKQDGTVIVWGWDAYGLLDVPEGLKNVKAIASKENVIVALKEDSTVVVWGNNLYNQCDVPQNLTNVKKVVAGATNIVALKVDGTVVVWGDNNVGQCNVPSGLQNVADITAGYHHIMALKVDGSVFGWGGNYSGQASLPVGGGYPTDISGGDGAMVLKDDGTVTIWGDDTLREYPAPNDLSDIKAIAAGPRHYLALKTDGTVIAWGEEGFDKLEVPQGLNNVKAIAAGFSNSAALKNDGTVIVWGSNNKSQCMVPANLNDVKAIAVGNNFVLALKENGTVVTWGDNEYSECKVPAGLTNVKAISACQNNVAALKEDGTVVVWGDNDYGQCDVPEGLTNVKAVSCGSKHVVVLKEDRTISVWGDNTYGQCDIPQGLTNVKAADAGSNHTILLMEDNSIVGFSRDAYYVIPFSKKTPDSTLVTSIKLNSTSATIFVGRTLQMSAVVVLADGTDKSVTWSISSQSGSNIATVSDTGLVTAVNAGTAVVRATMNADPTRFAECSVTVTDGVSMDLSATPIAIIGINNGYGDSAGIFVGLKDIRDSQGNLVEDARLTSYQIELSYNHDEVKILAVFDEAHLRQYPFEEGTDPNKVIVSDVVNQGTDNFGKLFFVPLVVTGSSNNSTDVTIKFTSLTDTNSNYINIPDVILTFKRGKIINEASGNPFSIADAVAGLQYLAKIVDSGTDTGKVNVINMASILPPETGTTSIKPSVKDVIALMQNLIGLRDDSFQLLSQP